MAPRACCRCSRGSSPHKGAWHGGARRTLRGAIGDRGHLVAPRHCHVALNVRGGTFTPEWQCAVHCHSVSIVPQRYAQGRMAVRTVRSGPSGSAAHTATRWRTCGAGRSRTGGSARRTGPPRAARRLLAGGRAREQLTVDILHHEASPRGREGFSADQAGLFHATLIISLQFPYSVF